MGLDAGAIKDVGAFAVLITGGVIVILKYLNTRKSKKEVKPKFGTQDKQLDYCKSEFKNMNLQVGNVYEVTSSKLRDLELKTEKKIEELTSRTCKIENDINKFELAVQINKSNVEVHDEKIKSHEEKILKIETNTTEFKVFEAEFKTELKYIKEGVIDIKDTIKYVKDIKDDIGRLLESANRRREDYE